MPCDYKRYPKDWKQIRARILERAGNNCEQCGVPNYSWVDKVTRAQCLCDEENVTRIVLTISHTDHDIGNNDPDNLKALCQRCHLRHDASHHQKNAARTRRSKLGMEDLFA